ncbi:MAG: hypothetical protein CVU46_14720 [Chloroflexi bacterium HGW-Chloroflexi-8]|nr:MAG: hypothetical protein CVU46_14720 [Chloroflexi bacterium HGW-Chloroflexi-8]
MKNLHIIKIVVFFLIISNLIIACTSAPPSVVPTLDQAVIVAAAVETISAQMTDTAIRNPSPTPLPTQTPIPPTATPLPPTETPANTQEPTLAPTQAAALSAKLRYVTTFPEDKRIYIPNEEYGLALGFENTGTIIWEAGSYVKLMSFKGEVTVQTQLSVDKAVAPGERVEFALWAFGSETLGDHSFVYQLFTSQGLAIPGGYATYAYKSE